MSGFDTLFPADSVEFCPHPDASDIILCGTYKLNEPTNTQKRSGRCIVLRANSERPDPSL